MSDQEGDNEEENEENLVHLGLRRQARTTLTMKLVSRGRYIYRRSHLENWLRGEELDNTFTRLGPIKCFKLK